MHDKKNGIKGTSLGILLSSLSRMGDNSPVPMANHQWAIETCYDNMRYHNDCEQEMIKVLQEDYENGYKIDDVKRWIKVER